MRAIREFDPSMCCATGVCVPTSAPDLARFSADLDSVADLASAAATAFFHHVAPRVPVDDDPHVAARSGPAAVPRR